MKKRPCAERFEAFWERRTEAECQRRLRAGYKKRTIYTMQSMTCWLENGEGDGASYGSEHVLRCFDT